MKRKNVFYDNPWSKRVVSSSNSISSNRSSINLKHQEISNSGSDDLESFGCPVCLKRFPLTLIQIHMLTHETVDKVANLTDLPVDEKFGNNYSPRQCLSSKSIGISNLSTKPSSSSSAFSVLMEAMNQKPKNFSFNLELRNSKLHPSIVFDNEVSAATTDRGRSVTAEPNLGWTALAILRKLPYRLKTEAFESVSMRIATNIPSMLEESSLATMSTFSYDRYVSILKSMLQKAVRRQRSSSAARLAIKLIELDSNEFYRRSVIIMVEDVSLHCTSPLLVWLVVAVSKGYRPPNFLIAACILSLVEVASSPWRDEVSFLETPNPPNTSLNLSQLPLSSGRTLIMSLLVRYSYGGTAGDMNLLVNAAKLWTKRLYPNHWNLTQTYNMNPGTAALSSHVTASDVSHCDKQGWDRNPSERFDEPGVNINQFIASAEFFLSKEYLNELLAVTSSWAPLVIPPIQRFDAQFRCSCSCRGLIDCEKHNGLVETQRLCVDIFDGISRTECLLTPASSHNFESTVLTNTFHAPLRQRDLLPEGIDAHCDSQLVEHVIAALSSQAGENNDTISHSRRPTPSKEEINSAIWANRGSVNTRRLWLDHHDQNRPLVDPFSGILTSLECYKDSIDLKCDQVNCVWQAIKHIVEAYCLGKVHSLGKQLCVDY